LNPHDISRPMFTDSSIVSVTSNSTASISATQHTTQALSRVAIAGIGVGGSLVAFTSITVVIYMFYSRQRSKKVAATGTEQAKTTETAAEAEQAEQAELTPKSELSSHGLYEIPQLATTESPSELESQFHHELSV
jgi:hypothetical protein